MDEAETIYTDPFMEEMERRKAHLEALPGARLKEDLDALNRCSYVFSRNAEELASHIARFIGSTRHVQQLSESYVNELVRFLHNYLTSVTSLIDAQRVVMRHRWPSEKKGEKSELETTEYVAHLRVAFDTGEADFMVKLRNYCTHYAIPVPSLGTTIRWSNGGPVVQVNTLQLDRDLLLRWDGWTASAKVFLRNQPPRFDFAPVIERYMKSAREFFGWFWQEIDTRSAQIKDELTSKATELNFWYEQNDPRPEWVASGGEPPPGWNGRREMRRMRARKRIERYEYGTRGYAVSVVDANGVITLGLSDWDPLPR